MVDIRKFRIKENASISKLGNGGACTVWSASIGAICAVSPPLEAQVCSLVACALRQS